MKLFRRTTRLEEATQDDWFWGRIAGAGVEEDRYWRRLSDLPGGKDVLPSTYLELHNQVYEAYNANPLANAIVEMGVNFVLGDGLRVTARHPKVQRTIDRFWRDPDNRMNLRQYDLATELSLYGEIFVRFFVNPYSGAVKIALLDPSLVDEIECDPENVERERRVHRRPVHGPSGKEDDGVWFAVPGEVMHFAVNKVSNAKRGKSDLATLLPWLRRYKDWLIDRVRINKYKAAFLWDVELQGADRQTIESKLAQYARPPEPGSVLVHNESEQWKAVQPNIDAGDAAADGHAIKLMVAMGAGLPEHYLSAGGDVNRATAAEMDLPVIKRYGRRQDYLGYVLRAILDRVIAEGQRAGSIPRTADTTYEVRFPPLQPEERRDIGTTAWHLAQGLQIARELDLVSQETASRLFLDALQGPGDEGAEVGTSGTD